jgi:hypothetical protein
MVYGSVNKELSFYFATDQGNYGKGGLYNQPFIVMDAFLTYAFAPELTIDVGMMLVPFSHHNIEGSAALHAMDYHAEMLRFPAGIAFRDFGVELRGLLANNLIHYRIGVFEGVRAQTISAVGMMPPPPPPPLNDTGLPRLTGMLRLNLLGSEPKFFAQGIYFSDKPIVTIGAGVDYQGKAVYKGVTPANANAPITTATLAGATPGTYLAINGDLFAECPLTEDDEVVVKGNVFGYGEGVSPVAGSTALARGGMALYGEAGVRHDWFEPLAFVEYLGAKDDSLKIFAPHFGLNLWFNKHTFNLKADVGYRKTDRSTAAGITTTKDIIGAVQAQLFF